MRGFWIFAFITLVLGACIDPIKLKVESEEGVIVVDGGIINTEGPYVVNLFRSIGIYNDLEKRPAVTGAFVYIIDEEGIKHRLIDDVPGIFVSDPSFKAEVGKAYYLRIEAFDKKIYESQPDVLKPIDDIGNVYFEFEDKVDTDPTNPENNAGFNVFVDANITSGADYVRWSWNGVYETQSFPERHTVRVQGAVVPDPPPCSGYQVLNGVATQVGPCSCCSCWVSEYSRSPEVGDVKFYGGKVSKYKIAYIPATKKLFLNKYRIEIEQSSISKEVYNYWELVKVQKEGGSSLFQPTSAKIKGNLKCINDPTAEIFGLFTVSSLKRKSIFIEKKDIPYKLLPIDSLNNDCRFFVKNASNVKPDFWQ